MWHRQESRDTVATSNGKPLPRTFSQQLAKSSLAVAGEQSFDIKAYCSGGGINGQAGAVGHGIAKCLVAMNEELRGGLREMGALTRDPRDPHARNMAANARAGAQFSKRNSLCFGGRKASSSKITGDFGLL